MDPTRKRAPIDLTITFSQINHLPSTACVISFFNDTIQIGSSVERIERISSKTGHDRDQRSKRNLSQGIRLPVEIGSIPDFHRS